MSYGPLEPVSRVELRPYTVEYDGVLYDDVALMTGTTTIELTKDGKVTVVENVDPKKLKYGRELHNCI